MWICRHANGHLQATGVDGKGRRQYLYHAMWTKLRAEAKFDRMIPFATKLHTICDSKGRPLSLFVTAGQVSDYIGALNLA